MGACPEVVDCFEEGHNLERTNGFATRIGSFPGRGRHPGVEQSEFLRKQERFEQVADPFGHRDDVDVAGLRSQFGLHPVQGFKDGKRFLCFRQVRRDAVGTGLTL